jgi:hypothetical protein
VFIHLPVQNAFCVTVDGQSTVLALVFQAKYLNEFSTAPRFLLVALEIAFV